MALHGMGQPWLHSAFCAVETGAPSCDVRRPVMPPRRRSVVGVRGAAIVDELCCGDGEHMCVVACLHHRGLYTRRTGWHLHCVHLLTGETIAAHVWFTCDTPATAQNPARSSPRPASRFTRQACERPSL